ncbi:hypothetical protein [Methanocella sp. MCL-LM]|uniref:hypothetical protein n=1 Tax=Methanocella sp. MCL-LM TaxID=3412035 RepID=UPI003C75B5CB
MITKQEIKELQRIESNKTLYSMGKMLILGGLAIGGMAVVSGVTVISALINGPIDVFANALGLGLIGFGFVSIGIMVCNAIAARIPGHHREMKLRLARDRLEYLEDEAEERKQELHEYLAGVERAMGEGQ